MNDLSPVEETLRSRGVKYRRVGERLLIKCTNPFHEDHNPSMYIYNDGTVHCFGCGHHTNVNNLFGIKVNQRHKSAILTKTVLDYVENELPEYPALKEPLVTQGYFGLSKNILETVDAREDYNGIIFPIYLNSRMVGWHKRLFNSDGPKYVSSHKITKTHFTSYFYPLDLVLGESKLILVEGVLDALMFLDYGFPAVSNFGVSLTKRKKELLKELIIEKIIIGFDLDDAGMMKEQDMYQELSDMGICVKTLPIGTSKNPRGSLSNDNYRRKVRELLDE